MKPPVTSDCSLAPKRLFVDWLKILANEKQAVQFRSPLVLVCEQKRCSHMPGASHHKQNSLSQFADDTAQWAFSLNVKFAANLLQQDLLKLAT